MGVPTSVASAAVRIPPMPSIRDLLKMYNLRAIKQLSQNFLLDERINNKIVKVAGDLAGKHVCEIGPGPGSITRAILRKDPAKLYLIERDTRFKPTLKLLQAAFPGKVQPHWGDVLSFNLTKLFPEETREPWDSNTLPPIHLIGNLPFSIATPLIIKWLRSISERSNAWTFGRVPLTLTFQLEVAQRIVADIMDEDRCRLSVMCQYLTEPQLKFTIPGSAFVPKPDVDVGVVRFIPLKEPRIKHPFPVVEKVTRQVFHLKPRDCWKGTGTLFPKVLRKDLIMRMLADAGIAKSTKPRQIAVEDIQALCTAYLKICDEYPVREYDHQGYKADVLWEKQYGHIFGYKVLKLNAKGILHEEFDYSDDELESTSTEQNDFLVNGSDSCTESDFILDNAVSSSIEKQFVFK